MHQKCCQFCGSSALYYACMLCRQWILTLRVAKDVLTRVVDDDDVEVGVGAALHTPEEVAACVHHMCQSATESADMVRRAPCLCCNARWLGGFSGSEGAHQCKEACRCQGKGSPMRPNPLMATLICLAWVICFEPLVPCMISQWVRRRSDISWCNG